MGPASTMTLKALAGDLPTWGGMGEPNGDFSSCPARNVIDRLLGKWTILLLLALNEQPHRFGELARLIPDISRRMLSQSLRDLERDGLISRHVLDVRPPGVEYRLTPLGRSAQEPLIALLEWAAVAHVPIRQAREAFDRRG